jgi:hypothetical protein
MKRLLLLDESQSAELFAAALGNIVMLGPYCIGCTIGGLHRSRVVTTCATP